METLYLLGGPPRTAKTSILSQLLTAKNVTFIPADAIAEGMRSVLTGQPRQMLRNIDITGSAEHKASISAGGIRKPFACHGSESELTLKATLGIIDYYASNELSVGFEGTAFTPAWVAHLPLADFTIRAAFVGYTKPSHADTVIGYAKQHPHDWINEWLSNEHGDETNIRSWIASQIDNCLKLQSTAAAHGYPFFDISTQSFEDYHSQLKQYFDS